MRRFATVAMTIAFITVSSSLTYASDSWESFMRLMHNHYLFDYQQINRVTCRVVVSTLDPVKLSEQLKSAGARVTLNENLRDFKVTYSKKDGITFITPHLEVVLNSTEGAADPKRVEQGVKMINDGAKQQIQGAIQIIQGVLDDFVSPKRETLANLEVSSAEGKTTVKYSKDGASYSEVYSGKSKKTVIKSPGTDIESNENFTDLNGKLALANAIAEIHQGETLLNTTIAIQYQDLGKMSFPSVLEQHLLMTGPNFKQEVQINISFIDCECE